MKNIIEFQCTEEVKTMFRLCLSVTGQSEESVFEQWVRAYADEVLSRAANQEKTAFGRVNREKTAFGRANRENTARGLQPCRASPSRAPAPPREKAHRVELWARRPHQYNHQIIKSFFLSEKEGVADYKKMQGIFVENTGADYYKFTCNFDSMKTDAGNSHGHIFDSIGNSVRLAAHIKDHVISLRESFIG